MNAQRKHIFVIGLDEEHSANLRQIPDADRFEFHPLLHADEVVYQEEYNLEIDFPFWMKPIKAYSSALGFRIENHAELEDALATVRDRIGGLGDAENDILARLARLDHNSLRTVVALRASPGWAPPLRLGPNAGAFVERGTSLGQTPQTKRPHSSSEAFWFGAPGTIRTCDRLVRSSTNEI
tara:strand:- start:17633 stop:18175 length:543 start_codon:yes stop_codon:yes gene_type:complete